MKKGAILVYIFLQLIIESICEFVDLCNRNMHQGDCNLKSLTLPSHECRIVFSEMLKQIAIHGDNITINCDRIVIRVDKAASLTLTNSILIAKDISIDLGPQGQGSSLTLDNSFISTNCTSDQVNNPMINDAESNDRQEAMMQQEYVCFASCEGKDYEINNHPVDSQYGYTALSYRLNNGDSDQIKGRNYYGSSSQKPKPSMYSEFRLGGGRIFIKADILSFLGEGSYISSSGCYMPQLKASGVGTGGTVLISLLNPIIANTRSLIRARSGTVFADDDTASSSGGRVYLQIQNEIKENFLKYNQLVQTSSYSGVPGTIHLANGLEELILIVGEETTLSNRYITVRDMDRLIYKGHTSDLYFSKARINLSIKKEQFRHVTFENKSAIEIIINDVMDSTTLEQEVPNIINIDSISAYSSHVKLLGKKVMKIKGQNCLLIDTYFELGDFFNLQIEMKSSFEMKSSSISMTELLVSQIIYIDAADILLSTSLIASNILFLNSRKKHTIINCELYGANSCFGHGVAKKMNDLVFMCSLDFRKSEHCNNLFEEMILHSNEGTATNAMASYLILNFTDSIITSSNKNRSSESSISNSIYSAGMVIINTKGSYILDPGSQIEISAMGCIGDKDNHVSKAHLKTCGPVGGQGLGLGSIGTTFSYERCKSFFKVPDTNEYRYATPGGGSNLRDSPSLFGRGGGAIIIKANKVDIQGRIHAMGSDSVLSSGSKGLKAGGGGGSLKISAGSIRIRLSPDNQIKLNGGLGKHNVGAGGGGKLILDCVDWASNLDCIDIDESSIEHIITTTSQEKTDALKLGYVPTISTFTFNRRFLFAGGVINKNYCLQGREGSFCTPCKKGYFKTDIGTSHCTICPCSVDLEKCSVGGDSMLKCNCLEQKSNIISLFEGYLIICTCGLLFSLIYLTTKSLTKEKEKNPLKTKLRFKQNDIPFLMGRINIRGKNTPSEPWEMDNIDSELKQYLSPGGLKLFKIMFAIETNYSLLAMVSLQVLRVISYSPGYLSLLRVFRISRVRNVVKLLESQKKLGIFINYNNQPLYLFKFTISSDLSAMYLNVVKDVSDKQRRLNWELIYPQYLDIFGDGSYNTPFKLEINDPMFTKLVDVLKERVIDSDSYFKEFDIPAFIVNSVRLIKENCHFMEYYFCNLNSYLKAISSFSPRENFQKSLFELCSYLRKINQHVLLQHGFEIRLIIVIEKFMGKKKKKDTINVDLLNSELRKLASDFLYDLINYTRLNRDERYSLKFMISRNLLAAYAINKNIRDLTYETSVSELSAPSLNPDKDGPIIQLRDITDRYKDSMIMEVDTSNKLHADFDRISHQYLNMKNNRILMNFYLFRLLLDHIYKHPLVKERKGYLPALIFILFLFDVSMLLAILYVEFDEAITLNADILDYVFLERVAMIPLNGVCLIALGAFSYATGWKVKISKMFVTVQMLTIFNLLIWFTFWLLLWIAKGIADSPQIVGYTIFIISIRLLQSKMICYQVSRVQASRTILKLLKNKNLWDN